MGVILESARFVRARWDLSDDDFRRILTFCTLLTLAAVVYAFTSNEQGGSLGGLFHGPAAARNVGITAVRTYTAFFRWQPMILFLFVAAQIFSTREKIPLFKISRWLSRQKRAGNAPAGNMNVSYPYFILCLFSASFHAGNGGLSFFWGKAHWWSGRCGGFVRSVLESSSWALAAAVVVGLGFFSQRGINALQRFAEGHDVQWLSLFSRPIHRPSAKPDGHRPDR